MVCDVTRVALSRIHIENYVECNTIRRRNKMLPTDEKKCYHLFFRFLAIQGRVSEFKVCFPMHDLGIDFVFLAERADYWANMYLRSPSALF